MVYTAAPKAEGSGAVDWRASSRARKRSIYRQIDR